MKREPKELTENYVSELVDLGKALRHARKKRGMSMRDLHAVSGVQFYQICNIENGKTGTKTATLHKLFNALETSIRDAYRDLELYEG